MAGTQARRRTHAWLLEKKLMMRDAVKEREKRQLSKLRTNKRCHQREDRDRPPGGHRRSPVSSLRRHSAASCTPLGVGRPGRERAAVAVRVVPVPPAAGRAGLALALFPQLLLVQLAHLAHDAVHLPAARLEQHLLALDLGRHLPPDAGNLGRRQPLGVLQQQRCLVRAPLLPQLEGAHLVAEQHQVQLGRGVGQSVAVTRNVEREYQPACRLECRAGKLLEALRHRRGGTLVR
eukprot:scaffold2352_cov103-Isochrysis_galbana.AAC.2